MKKPVIGIVSSKEYIDKGGYKKPVYDVNEDYINLIQKFGGIPIIIPYVVKVKELENFLDNIDGLLLIGGEDISKKCFVGKKSSNLRDDFEIAIYNYFKEKHRPILGICRGLQLINVAEGGTLKDIVKSKIEHFIGNDGWINYHEIKINEGTKLFQMLNEKIYTVSSVHHQQIEKLGVNLVISAVSNDDVVEAIEIIGDDFILGFQGHIEKCIDNFNKYGNVMKKFIKEANNEKRKNFRITNI